MIGLALILALVGLAYLHVAGFPPFLIRAVERQVAQMGLAARFTEIRLDLFRGIVAREARLADVRDPNRTLVRIGEVALEPNWGGLTKGRLLRALRVVNATVAVPTPPDESGPSLFSAEDAYATVLFNDDGTIQLDRLTGLYCGIRLYVTGRLKPATREEHPPTESSPFRFITKIVRELNRVHVSNPPQLDLNFDVDMARPLESRGRARLFGSGMELRGVHVDEARVVVKMQDGAVEIQQFDLELYRGKVEFRGRYDIANGGFDLQVTSSTDPTAFAAFATPDIAEMVAKDLKVRENPHITLRYLLSPETGTLPQLTGTVNAGAFSLRGVPFQKVKFAFGNRGPDMTVTNALVVMPEGQLTGQGEFNIESTAFHYEFDSTLNPPKLLPLMVRTMERIVEPSQFDTSPHIVASVSGDFIDPDAFAYDATVTAGDCSYRGVRLQSASAKLKLRESQLDVRDLQLVRDEGEATGTVQADFNEHRVNFDIACTANPNAMAAIVGEKPAAILHPYRFGRRTDSNIRGLVDFENSSNTTWAAHAIGEGFSYWKLTADRAEANLLFTNNTMRIDDFHADFYDGELTGSAFFSFADTNTTYRFEMQTEHTDVNKMLTSINGSAKTTGFLTGKMELEGKGGDPHDLIGHGSLTINDGILWEAPLFGIISHILGNTQATSAKCDFKISKYAWRTDNLAVEAGAFTAHSKGKVDFDGKLDFRVQAQFLRSIPGINIITKIIGLLLEYDVGGTISHPSYRAANLPKEILPHSTSQHRENEH